MDRTVGNILKEARQQKDLVLREVAAACGVAASTLSRIENDGEAEFSNVVKFAYVVGVDLNELGEAVRATTGNAPYLSESRRDGWAALL